MMLASVSLKREWSFRLAEANGEPVVVDDSELGVDVDGAC